MFKPNSIILYVSDVEKSTRFTPDFLMQSLLNNTVNFLFCLIGRYDIRTSGKIRYRPCTTTTYWRYGNMHVRYQ